MAELITASEALKLASPTKEEGLERYKEIVSTVITEAAMGQLKSVSIAVPEMYSGSIQLWLCNHGYITSVIPDDLQYWSAIEINWGSVNDSE